MNEVHKAQQESENTESENKSLLSANDPLHDYVKTLEKKCLPNQRKYIYGIKRPSRQFKTFRQEAEKALWFAEAFG